MDDGLTVPLSKQRLLTAIESHPKFKDNTTAWRSYHKDVSDATTPAQMMQVKGPPAKGMFGLGQTRPERTNVENAHNVFIADAKAQGMAQHTAASAARKRSDAARVVAKKAADDKARRDHDQYWHKDKVEGPGGKMMSRTELRELEHKAAAERRAKEQARKMKKAAEEAEEALIGRITERMGMTYEAFEKMPSKEQRELIEKQHQIDEDDANQRQSMGDIMGSKVQGGTRRKRHKSRRGKTRKGKSRKHKKSKRKTRRGKKHQKKRTKRRHR